MEQEESHPRRVKAHGALATVFILLVALVLRRLHRDERMPERIDVQDIMLIGVASFKLSRLLSKSKVTDFIRAPFTEPGPAERPGEVEDKPKAQGPWAAVGELVVCPFCLSVWIASGLTSMLLYAPRTTRYACSIAAAAACADGLQQAYVALDYLRSREVAAAQQAAQPLKPSS